jgi:hypothetical protein
MITSAAPAAVTSGYVATRGVHPMDLAPSKDFAVTPTKILAFAKGNFSHPRHRF